MAPHTTWQRTIGILGGLGPHAHLEFERLLLERAAESLGRPAADQDYPPWVLCSVPDTPDRTLALLNLGESPLERLAAGARALGAADFIVIPCNAAHAFLPALRRLVARPFLDMIDETLSEAERLAGSRATVGLLATDGTLRAGVYRDAAERRGGMRVLSLADLPGGAAAQESLVMESISGPLRDGTRQGGGIKSGAHHDPERRAQLHARLAEAVARLAAAGADLVVLGCTELPLVLGRGHVGGVVTSDPMDVAARACLAIAGGSRGLP